MKRIIEGKVYDTEKAELIEEDWYLGSSDFRHTFQELYITKKGVYFFHGGGGPASDYAEPVGNNSVVGSERIWLPKDLKDVIDWLSEKNVEKAVELFPDRFEEA